MRSAVPKILHDAAGLPLVEHVLRVSDQVSPQTVVVVLGYQAEHVRPALASRPNLQVALQEPQLGTGHALLQAEPALAGAAGTLVLLSGDVPLLRVATLRALIDRHEASQAAATVLTAIVDDPSGYGRIVREDGRIVAIVEDRDANPQQAAIREINSGIYAFDLATLFESLREIGTNNAQGEYYLPDLFRIHRERGRTVDALALGDPHEIMGVNSRKELAEAAALLKVRRNEELMAAGVTIVDPDTAYIGPDVAIGADTVIHPNVQIEGHTSIGSGCVIQSGVRITNAVLGDDVFVNNCCVIVDSTIGRGACVGPFAHLRPESTVGDDAHIGNFVELKKTAFGRGSKASHLAYLGDAAIGERVNSGAGTITCNYDGTAKHRTVVEDGAFIGSDSQLIAPVKVGPGAYVAAGSSITDDVPGGALAISRSRQVNKDGWVERKRKQKS